MLRLRIAKRRQQPDGARCSCELARTRSCVHPPCSSRCAIYACAQMSQRARSRHTRVWVRVCVACFEDPPVLESSRRVIICCYCRLGGAAAAGRLHPSALQSAPHTHTREMTLRLTESSVRMKGGVACWLGRSCCSRRYKKDVCACRVRIRVKYI